MVFILEFGFLRVFNLKTKTGNFQFCFLMQYNYYLVRVKHATIETSRVIDSQTPPLSQFLSLKHLCSYFITLHTLSEIITPLHCNVRNVLFVSSELEMLTDNTQWHPHKHNLWWVVFEKFVHNVIVTFSSQTTTITMVLVHLKCQMRRR